MSTTSSYGLINVRSWASVRAVGERLDGWIFRGQANADWGLKPSLERAVEQASAIDTSLAKILDRTALEKVVLSRFEENAHHYVSRLPSSRLEWMSLIQHYSGPTRLLDFTRSFYVAAFFAMQNYHSARSSALWAVNERLLLSLYTSFLQDSRQRKSANQFDMRTQCNKIFESMITRTKPAAMVLPVTPERTNERIAIQQGLFLCPMSLSRSFEDNLFDPFDCSRKETLISSKDQALLKEFLNFGLIIKICIPTFLRSEILLDLSRMNITTSTLFPGLEGFSRSLHYLLEQPLSPEFHAKIGKRIMRKKKPRIKNERGDQ